MFIANRILMFWFSWVLSLCVCFGLFGCASKVSGTSVKNSSGRLGAEAEGFGSSVAEGKSLPSWRKNNGGYYMDDGPLDTTGIDFEKILEPIPKVEILHRFANRPYNVFGTDYVPQTDLQQTFSQTGTGSWYGRKFHGQKTSSGEIYDMFAMTAAHPTLPIPSYARVTHTASGKSVVVRVNDRGPFLHQRVIDLSYAAAHRLGYVKDGSAALHVEKITPSMIVQGQSFGQGGASVNAVVSSLRPVVMPVLEATAGGVTVAAPPEFSGGSLVKQALGGFFLQLGSFSVEENAQALKSRLSLEFSAELPNLMLVQKTPLIRLVAGPYRNREDALSVSLRLKQAAGLNTFLITR